MSLSTRAVTAKKIVKTPMLRNILIVSLVVAIAIPVVSAFWIIPAFTQQLTTRTEDQAVRTATHLMSTIIIVEGELKKESLSAYSLGKIKIVSRDFQLENLKIFSKSGETIFSTDAKDIGKINKKDYFHNIVAKGDLFTKIERKGARSSEGRIVTSDVVETYVPIMRNSKFMGAFEIYYDITDSKKKLDHLLTQTYGLLFGIAAILLLALILILFRASKNLIERDQASEALKQAHDNLEKRVEERTEELIRINEILKTEIAERKIAEGALRESEERHREMVEKSTDAIISINEKAKIMQWNQAATDLFGHDKGSVIGKSIDILIPAKYKQPHKKGLNRIIETGKSEILGKVMELEGLHKEGKSVHIELSLSGLKKGASWIFTGIIRETTERRKALKALRDSEERYRSLFEDSRDAIMIWTPEDKILGANQSALETFGYTIEEMIGLDVSQIFSNQTEQSRFKEELIQKGAVRGYEVAMQRKDNSVMDTLLTSTVRLDKKGNILGYQGILRDITLQKLSEKKLQNTLDTLRKAMGATIQAMSLMVESRDPYTAGHQHRVSDLSRTIATELSLPADQIDGIRFSAMIHDLGKMAVPAEILTKPGKLSKKEFEIIKDHAQTGYDILKGIEFPWPVAQTVLEHHEKLDGSGYPQGLSGEEISLEARILCVADVVEAMASHRPYRPSLGIEKALEEISAKRGTAFDSDVVDACIKIFRDKQYQLK